MAQQAWVGFEETMDKHRATLWLRQVAPGAEIVAISCSTLGTVHFANANLGLATLPTALGDAEPHLVRLLGPVTELTRSLSHADHPSKAAQGPAFRPFLRFMTDEPPILRPILTG